MRGKLDEEKRTPPQQSSRFCTCEEKEPDDLELEFNGLRPPLDIEMPTSGVPQRKLLRRLSRELQAYEGFEGLIVQRHDKKAPPRFRKKGVYRNGSRFIGVSRNGKKWQALLLVKDRKRYLGTLNEESETALLYDRNAILFHGLNKVRKEMQEIM